MSALSIVAVLVGLLIAMIFRYAALILVLIVIIWVYTSWTSDPVRDHNQVQMRQYEEEQVQAQKAKVMLTQVDVTFEPYGDRAVQATVRNGSVAKISQIALKCAYERSNEEDPWRVTTPVASTGEIQPGESKRFSFLLMGAASDAIASSFDCRPDFFMDQGDLMRAKVVKAKTSEDKRIAQSDVRIEARLGQAKLDYVPVIARGSITNNSQAEITRLDLSCSARVHELGRVETIYGGTSIYVAPGETKPFDFVVNKIKSLNPKFGVQDTSC